MRALPVHGEAGGARLRQITDHVFAEFFFWGCNPGYVATSDGVFMIDTPQQPIDAVRWREHLEGVGPIRHLVNTEPHIDHIAGNAYFPGVEVITTAAALKREHCHPGDVLVDDRDKHRHLWEQAGGVFIHHKGARSSIAELRAKGFLD